MARGVHNKRSANANAGSRRVAARHAGTMPRGTASASLVSLWMRASPPRRVLVAITGLLATLVLLAAIMGAVRLVQYLNSVRSAQEQQETLAAEYQFNPGNIITDEKMFDTTSMDEQAVQEFLDENGSDCTGSMCLKDYAVDTEDKPADELCATYHGTSGQSAAAIIDASARACGISQRVLLTMLQKEQHLVTASEPTEQQYSAAMGLSCPDTDSCDPAYAGFHHQVYGAARRLRFYMAHPDQYSYRSGRLNDIRYHPNAACGSSKVYIENTATALLYIYTPYQPNEAALKAGAGEGDECSSYGNRNFSLIYSGWFGDPAQGY